MGVTPGFEMGVSHTTMHCPPVVRNSGVAARAAISCPSKSPFYDVIRLGTFSSLLLVGFCWTGGGLGLEGMPRPMSRK